jgi:hypothetical protein
MFSSPPRSISMALVVGGVTHDPIKARCRMELARAASAIAFDRRRHIHRRRHPVIAPAAANAAVAFSASAITASKMVRLDPNMMVSTPPKWHRPRSWC